MRYRLIFITFITGLLITGCNSGMSSQEQTKLAEYKTCLETTGLVMANSDYPQNQNKAVTIKLIKV
jgi:hypothetical protein